MCFLIYSMLCITPGCDDTHGEGSFSDDLCKLIYPGSGGRWQDECLPMAQCTLCRTLTWQCGLACVCDANMHRLTQRSPGLYPPRQAFAAVHRRASSYSWRTTSKQNQQRQVTNGNKQWQTSAISLSLDSQVSTPQTTLTCAIIDLDD